MWHRQEELPECIAHNQRLVWIRATQVQVLQVRCRAEAVEEVAHPAWRKAVQRVQVELAEAHEAANRLCKAFPCERRDGWSSTAQHEAGECSKATHVRDQRRHEALGRSGTECQAFQLVANVCHACDLCTQVRIVMGGYTRGSQHCWPLVSHCERKTPHVHRAASSAARSRERQRTQH